MNFSKIISYLLHPILMPIIVLYLGINNVDYFYLLFHNFSIPWVTFAKDYQITYGNAVLDQHSQPGREISISSSFSPKIIPISPDFHRNST